MLKSPVATKCRKNKVEWNSDISQFIIDDISIGSRTRVGGDQVDEKIVDYLFDKYSRIQRLSAPDQKKLRHELRIYAEKFKQVWGAEYIFSQDKEENQILVFWCNLLSGVECH